MRECLARKWRRGGTRKTLDAFAGSRREVRMRFLLSGSVIIIIVVVN
jgi:hypothetical protein